MGPDTGDVDRLVSLRTRWNAQRERAAAARELEERAYAVLGDRPTLAEVCEYAEIAALACRAEGLADGTETLLWITGMARWRQTQEGRR